MPMSPRPNLVIFNPDQWRGDVLGHLGNPAAITPNLDAWAATEAVSFRNAFTQNTVCTPSRTSFMTGWYPHVRGHRTMFHMLRPDEPMLLKRLKDASYFVWWGGKNDLVPAQKGFADYCDVKYSPSTHPPSRPVRPNLHLLPGWRTEQGVPGYYSFYAGRIEGDPPDGRYYDSDWFHIEGAIDFIRDRPRDPPFCIYLPLFNPHVPYGVKDPWFSIVDRSKLPARAPVPDWTLKPSMLAGMYERQGIQSWTEEQWTELRAVYYGKCARVYHQFGLLMDALRETGVYDNTAVFVFADHGDLTGDYGVVEKCDNVFPDPLTRVPFLIKPPEGTPVRARVSVELVDFPATVEALVGLEPTHTHFGRSLLPALAGDTDEHRDAVFTEGGRLHGEVHAMELESGEHGWPTGHYWPNLSLQQSEGPEHTKAVMCRTRDYKYVRRLYESDELYDLRADPQEVVNRINDPALAAVLSTLRDRMLTFFLETGDVVPHDADLRS